MTEAKKSPPGGDRPTKNIVHEQAILVETIKKELREQKLTEHFSINPFTKSKRLVLYRIKAFLTIEMSYNYIKGEILAGKPNVYPDEIQDEADSNFFLKNTFNPF